MANKINFITVISVLTIGPFLVALKLSEYIHWSWMFVLLPFYGPGGIVIGAVMIGVIYFCSNKIVDSIIWVFKKITKEAK